MINSRLRSIWAFIAFTWILTTMSPPSSAHTYGIERQPRFVHIVSNDCTLKCLAERLGLPVTRLLTYNQAVHDRSLNLGDPVIPEGTKLYIPIHFPLHSEMEALKTDVLELRFVAAYGMPAPFSRVGEIKDWFEQRLMEYGYEMIDVQNRGALHFTGGWIARGTVEFSPGDDTHPTLVDVALVVNEEFPFVSQTSKAKRSNTLRFATCRLDPGRGHGSLVKENGWEIILGLGKGRT